MNTHETRGGGWDVTLSAVSTVLWRERELLELLLFKLEEEQLLLAAGRTRWLAHATREVEVVLEQIREAEMLRAMEVDAVAAELSLPPAPSLRLLAEKAPAPWDELFAAHRDAFLVLTQEISATAAANRDVLTAGQRAAQEALVGIESDVQTYGRDARTTATAGDVRARFVDEAF